MAKTKRATIYFDPDLHKALRLKGAETDESMSDLVDQALRAYLSEDLEDLADLKARVNEPTIGYEALVRKMQEAGEI